MEVMDREDVMLRYMTTQDNEENIDSVELIGVGGYAVVYKVDHVNYFN